MRASNNDDVEQWDVPPALLSEDNKGQTDEDGGGMERMHLVSGSDGAELNVTSELHHCYFTLSRLDQEHFLSVCLLSRSPCLALTFMPSRSLLFQPFFFIPPLLSHSL